MKKILTLFIALTMVHEGFSQTVVDWNFTTLTSFPAGFVTWNDANTLNSYITTNLTGVNANTGWSLDASDFGEGVAICATYFTSSSATANRWLVTADVTVPTGQPNVGLVWTMYSLGPILGASVLDNYNVLVSTTDSNETSFTTTLLTVTGEQGGTHAIPLAQFAGQRIRIAFQDNTQNGIGLVMTDAQVVVLPAAAITVNDVEIYEHNYINNPVNVTGLFTNAGLDTINSYYLNYSVNGGAPVTSTQVTGAGILSQTEYYYTHPTPFNPTTAGTYTIQVWFSQLNGSNVNSDTSSVTIFYYPMVSGLVKNVVVEEMTGAGCPWCPGGGLALRDVVNNLPYVIPVAIHSADINDLGVSPADAMQIPDGQTVVTACASGFPTGMVDRLYSFDNATLSPSFYNGYYMGPDSVNSYIWDTLSVFRKTQATPVNVSLSVVSFDSTTSTNNLVVTVNATFLNSLSQGTYNMNFYVVEDSLIITGNGYNQDNNAYSSAGSFGLADYNELYNLPAVLIDNGQVGEYSQNHVLRAMGGGPWGTTGIIPSAPVAGTTYSNTYTVSVPSTWRYNYIKLVGLVQEYSSNVNMRTILNAAQINLIDNNAGIRQTTEFNSISVYPNPASSVATVEMDIKQDAMVNISVINSLGEVALEPSDVLLNAGAHSVNIPVSGLSSGLYMVKISANGETNTVPLSITTK